MHKPAVSNPGYQKFRVEVASLVRSRSSHYLARVFHGEMARLLRVLNASKRFGSRCFQILGDPAAANDQGHLREMAGPTRECF